MESSTLLKAEQALVVSMIDQRGQVAPDRVAEAFRMSKAQLAQTLGLAPDTLYKVRRVDSAKPQARLKEMLEIITRISEWAGGKEQAMAWYRAQPIAAFGGRTAEGLVKEGQAGHLRDYLDHLALGNFA